MTNGEKYKTAQERSEAFIDHCEHCWKTECSVSETIDCFAHWLDLEADEEKPLPCPFCGGETKATANFGGVHFVMCECGYSSTETSYKESAIAAHNRVAKAAKESEAK